MQCPQAPHIPAGVHLTALLMPTIGSANEAFAHGNPIFAPQSTKLAESLARARFQNKGGDFLF